MNRIINAASRLAGWVGREPVRARIYGILAVALPVLPLFGVDLTDVRTDAILTLAYAVLGLGVERARARVSPVR